jgi:UPF0755 protein
MRTALRSSLRLAWRLALVLALALAAGYLAWQYEKRRPALAPGSPAVTVVVPPGASVADIARIVFAKGLVRHPLVLRVLALERRAETRLKAGEYRFSASQSAEQILDALVRGDVVHRRVTLPEGRSIDDMARIVEAAGELSEVAFRRAAGDPAAISDLDPLATDLEGYLFPDTYEIPRIENASQDLVARMVARFRKRVGPLLPQLGGRGLSLREVVTLASLVELETARPEERARIAAVFLNRLKLRMPLQTDPTVIYALRRAGRYDGNIRKGDLDIASPYNTYRHAGLPPGPIASPGLAALEAVLHPAPTSDLYFVSRNDGTHQFSTTLRDHERAVDRYQRHRQPQAARADERPAAGAAAAPRSVR